MNEDQQKIATIAGCVSTDNLIRARTKSPSNPIAQTIASNSKISPSKSLKESQQRIIEKVSILPSRQERLINDESKAVLISQSHHLLQSHFRKLSAGKRTSTTDMSIKEIYHRNTVTRNFRLLKNASVSDPGIGSVRDSIPARKYQVGSRRRAYSLDDLSSDKNLLWETGSPRRTTKENNNLATLGQRPSRRSVRRITRTKASEAGHGASDERKRIPNYIESNVLAAETCSPSMRRSEESSRSCSQDVEHVTCEIKISCSSSVNSSASSVGWCSDTDRHFIDSASSDLKWSKNHHQGQKGRFSHVLFSPRNNNATGDTPVSSSYKESKSLDSTNRFSVLNSETDLRLFMAGSLGPSLSGDKALQRQPRGHNNKTFQEDYENGTDTSMKYGTKSRLPLTFISFVASEDNDEDCSLSIESSEDHSHSNGSVCPSISDCISMGTSMTDEAPKMPERRMSHLTMTCDSALGAFDDDIRYQDL